MVLSFVVGLGLAAPVRAAPPRLTARAAILVEASSGEVVLARAADAERPIASTTKLMTALLTLERASLDDVFTAPAYRAAPAETRIGLRAGERMRVGDLLRALLLPSANDAAATLARGVAGTQGAFVRAMNRRAQQLGLAHTHYANPIGLDAAANHSSARDLATLARRLLRDRFFGSTVDRARAVLRSGDRRRTVVNRNLLVRSVPWVDGVKTGHTSAAGYVLVGAGTRRGVTVISAVLGEPSEAARDADTLALLRYGLARYRLVEALRVGRVVGRVGIRGHRTRVALVPARSFALVTRRARPPTLRLEVPDALRGPLRRGARAGTVAVVVRGRTVTRVPLLTAASVPGAAGGGRRTVLVAALLGAIALGVALTLRRRRDVTPRRRPRRGSETAA